MPISMPQSKYQSKPQPVIRHSVVQRWGRMALVPAIAVTSWGLPAIVAPQSSPLAAQSVDLCRLTKTTTTRFQSNSLGSATLGKIPAEIPVILTSPADSRRSPLAEVKYPRQYAGFVPIDALGACSPGGIPDPAPPTTPMSTSVCRRVIAKAAPPGVPIKLRSKPMIPTDDPQSNVVGRVSEGAFVYVVTDGKGVQSLNDGVYTWVQIDLKQTRTVDNKGRFTISSATDPAAVWMFNTDVSAPKLGNLALCPP
jgi:hypothetical protein